MNTKTFEAYYQQGQLRGWFLVPASNFRKARAIAMDYLAACGILPVEVLRVRLKTWGLQLEPEHANRLIDPCSPRASRGATPGFDRLTTALVDRWSLGAFLAMNGEQARTTEER